jgi:hypothetical protein
MDQSPVFDVEVSSFHPPSYHMTNLLQRLSPDLWRLLGKYVQANNLQVCDLHWQELLRDDPASLALPCNCSGSSTVMYEEDGEHDRLECKKGFDSACHCKRAFYYGAQSNHRDYIIASGQRDWKEACRIFEAAKSPVHQHLLLFSGNNRI